MPDTYTALAVVVALFWLAVTYARDWLDDEGGYLIGILMLFTFIGAWPITPLVFSYIWFQEERDRMTKARTQATSIKASRPKGPSR